MLKGGEDLCPVTSESTYSVCVSNEILSLQLAVSLELSCFGSPGQAPKAVYPIPFREREEVKRLTPVVIVVRLMHYKYDNLGTIRGSNSMMGEICLW